MNAPRYARISARLLAEESTRELDLTDEERARAIAVIALALAAKTRRRARRIAAWGLGAAAALVLLSYAGLHAFSRPTASAIATVSAVVKPSGSGTEIRSPAGAQPLVGAASFGQGGRLVAGNRGGATVQLSTGTELAVAHDTNVEFESAGPVERFFLKQGALQAKVAKLGTGERFIVRTPDAEIEVRGTAFRVAVVDPEANCADGARTRVFVNEGIVEVRSAGSTAYVHPGETWPVGCAATLSAVPNAVGPVRVVPRALSSTRVAGPPSALAIEEPKTPAPASNEAPSREASSIAQQNALFSEASRARQRGDSARAIGTFETLIARYPTSPLAESSAVQRMNLLQSRDPAAAQNAAREYLARYPQGYARTDAERLLAQP